MVTKPVPLVLASEHAIEKLSQQSTKAERLRSAVLKDDDPEAVHDLRVAVRRARRAVQTFQAFLPPEAITLEEHLHKLFHLLGEVRDLDIALSILARLAETKAGFEEIRDRLSSERAKAKSCLQAELGSGDPLEELAGLIRGDRSGDLQAVPLKAAAPDLLRQTFRKAKRVATHLDAGADAAKVHELRKRAKRLRDVLEFFVPIYRSDARRVVEALKKLQDLLGEHQDLVIVAAKLGGMDKLSDEAGSLTHKAIEEIERKRADLREAIPAEAKGFGGKDWKRLRKRMIRERRQLWMPRLER